MGPCPSPPCRSASRCPPPSITGSASSLVGQGWDPVLWGVPSGPGEEAWHESVFLERPWTCMLGAFENVACEGLSSVSPLNKNTPTVELPPAPSNPAPRPWIRPFTAHNPSKTTHLLSR